VEQVLRGGGFQNEILIHKCFHSAMRGILPHPPFRVQYSHIYYKRSCGDCKTKIQITAVSEENPPNEKERIAIARCGC
jgi:hypothetical protein